MAKKKLSDWKASANTAIQKGKEAMGHIRSISGRVSTNLERDFGPKDKKKGKFGF